MFVASVFCQTPGNLFTEAFSNDGCVIGQLGQVKAQGFTISVVMNFD